MRNYLGAGQDWAVDSIVRLFQHNPAYRFSGAIHEQVAPAILKANGDTSLAPAPMIIHHYGYLSDRIKAKEKHSRNMGDH